VAGGQAGHQGGQGVTLAGDSGGLKGIRGMLQAGAKCSIQGFFNGFRMGPGVVVFDDALHPAGAIRVANLGEDVLGVEKFHTSKISNISGRGQADGAISGSYGPRGVRARILVHYGQAVT
jgi:hypothetical protein